MRDILKVRQYPREHEFSLYCLPHNLNHTIHADTPPSEPHPIPLNAEVGHVKVGDRRAV